MNVWKKVYGVCFFALCLCPSIGMLWATTDGTAENRKLSELPELHTEEGWNLKWLSELGDYFQEHFAYRQELVTANALLQGKALGVSTVGSVVQGTDGWLYYTDSLDDYLGINLLPERSLYNIAHTLKITQENLNSRGIRFLYAAPANKNSLYGEHMPYYDAAKVTDENNWKRLQPLLEEAGISYVDLHELFLNQEETLYHQRDSHWNNKGAMMAGDLMLTALGKEHDSYENVDFEIRTDFEGDLDKMIYPQALTLEDEIYFDKEMTYEYVGEVESNFDPKIYTVNPSKDGSLVMYRDSFGIALLPFIADEYGKAYFSRGVPYQMNDVVTNEADTVIFERVERFFPDAAKNPPVLAAVELNMDFLDAEAAAVEPENLEVIQQGLFWKITGQIPAEYMEEKTNIYIRMDETSLYEAFPMNVSEGEDVNPYGFVLYISTDAPVSENSKVEVFASAKSSTAEDYWIPEPAAEPEEEITEELFLPDLFGAPVG